MNSVTSIPDSKRAEETSIRQCAGGHAIPSGESPDDCLLCWYGVAVDAAQGPKFVGDYELLGKIGEGGMGIVYKARHIRTERIVALKMIRDGELASDAEVIRFYDESKAAGALDHPNIVPIYHVGEDDGEHYFTMKWMRGGSLADHIKQYRGDCRRAAEFVVVIARAVHYGHQRLILHRDLKPANILLDHDGTPHVADFGLAKRLDKNNSLGHSDMMMDTSSSPTPEHPPHQATWGGSGTLQYMAPEQAQDKPVTTPIEQTQDKPVTTPIEQTQRQPLTWAADVYGLGVILYELLTSRTPFEGDDSTVIIKQVQHDPPPDPCTIEPRIDTDLAAICLRCLQKKPENRYESADALARDLQRYLEGEPILPVSRIQRTWRWCKRKPLMAALIVEAALLVMVATIAAFSGAAAQEQDRTEEMLRANEYAARWVAGTVLFKFNGYRDMVAKAAREFPQEHIDLLQLPDVHENDDLQAYCLQLADQHKGFDWFLMDKEGTTRARSPNYPKGKDNLGKNYVWRDYFKGAWKLGEARLRSAHIGRAILSEPNETYRYMIAAPIYNEKGEPSGVLLASTNTGKALGTLELKDPNDNRHIAMVVAPYDNNRDSRNNPLPEDHVILVHDSLKGGQTEFLKSHPAVRQAITLAEMSNPNRGFDQLLLPEAQAVVSSENFCDPVMDGSCVDAAGQTRAGKWIAGFAPIGNTGFVAIVETPRAAAARPNQTLLKRLLLWGVLPFFLGTALVAAIVSIARRTHVHGKPCRRVWCYIRGFVCSGRV